MAREFFWNFFELAINAIECFIILDFLSQYLGCRYAGMKKWLGFSAFLIICVVEITFINLIVPFEGIISLLAVALHFFYAVFFLQGKTWNKLFLSCLVMAAVMIIAVGSNLAFGFLFGRAPLEIILIKDDIRFMYVLFTKIVLFYFTRTLINHKQQPSLSFAEWVHLLGIPALSIGTISFLMGSVLDDNDGGHYAAFCAVGILATNVITYYWLVRINRQHKLKMEYEILKQQYEAQGLYMNDVQKLHLALSKMCHEMKNHYGCLKTLLLEEDVEKATLYLEDILGENARNMKKMCYSGNSVLDSIINLKSAMCEEEKITVTNEIHHNLDTVSDTDISVLIGNLYDNAIEACKNCKENKREIYLSIQRQGAYVSVFMKNTIAHSVLSQNPQLKTNKKDSAIHGFGIKNIKNVIEKHEGMIDYFEENQTFSCDIILNITN